MRAASATSSTTNMTSSPIILTTRPPAAGHDVVGDLLEPPHDGGELLVAQVLAEEREADHVGESHGEHRALPRGQAVAAQHHAALDPRRHLAPPDELEELGHGGNGHVGHAGEGLGRQDGVDLRAHHVARDELGLGDPCHRRADDPGHLHRRVGVGGAERLQALEEAHRLEVEIGEGRVVVVDAGEPERPPEALELVEVDAGELGHLDPGVAPARRDEHAVGHEEVDHTVGDGPVDLLLGGPVHEEDLLDVVQRRLAPGLVVVVGGRLS